MKKMTTCILGKTIFCLLMLILLISANAKGYPEEKETLLKKDKRFSYTKTVIGVSQKNNTAPPLETKWQVLVNPNITTYQIRIYFNNLELATIKDSKITILRKPLLYLGNDLAIDSLGNQTFQMMLNMYRMPVLYRIVGLHENITYKVRYSDQINEVKYVTQIDYTCKTRPLQGLHESGSPHPCSSILYSHDFPKAIFAGSLLCFLVILSCFILWILRGQKRMFRKKHTTLRKKGHHKSILTSTVSDTRSGSIDSSASGIVGILKPPSTPKPNDQKKNNKDDDLKDQQITITFQESSPVEFKFGIQANEISGNDSQENEKLKPTIEDFEWSQFQSAEPALEDSDKPTESNETVISETNAKTKIIGEDAKANVLETETGKEMRENTKDVKDSGNNSLKRENDSGDESLTIRNKLNNDDCDKSNKGNMEIDGSSSTENEDFSPQGERMTLEKESDNDILNVKEDTVDSATNDGFENDNE